MDTPNPSIDQTVTCGLVVAAHVNRYVPGQGCKGHSGDQWQIVHQCRQAVKATGADPINLFSMAHNFPPTNRPASTKIA